MTSGCLTREEGCGYPTGKRKKSIFEEAIFNESRYSRDELKDRVERSVDMEEMGENQGPDLSKKA